MKRFLIIFLWVGILIAAFFPPERLLRWERGLGATLVKLEHHEAALRIYWWLAFRDDVIGLNNWHVVDTYLSTSKSKDARRTASRSARKAWEFAGNEGVGAAYWNRAMQSIRSGPDQEKQYARATDFLARAEALGIAEAGPLLGAGLGEDARIAALMNLGDPVAAMIIANRMHFAGDTESKDAASLTAALSGSPGAMVTLGWSLANRRDANRSLYKFWLVKAANAGAPAAMMRLGRCYKEAIYFCDTVDLDEAKKWFRAVASSKFTGSYPKIWIDEDLALRRGVRPGAHTTYPRTKERALRELQELSAGQ